jgi:hypothetical protein
MRGRLRVCFENKAQAVTDGGRLGGAAGYPLGMSLKSSHTRHRAKSPVSPRATRPSVRKLNRAKAKPKASKK